MYITGEHIGLFAQNSILKAPRPKQDDIVISFGTAPHRFYFTKQLIKEAKNRWILCDPTQSFYPIAREDGFSQQKMHPLFFVSSTYTEIVGIDSILISLKEKKLISDGASIYFISTPSHLARIQLTVDKIIEPSNHKHIYVGLPQSWMQFPKNYYTHWWLYKNMWREVIKYLGYSVLY